MEGELKCAACSEWYDADEYVCPFCGSGEVSDDRIREAKEPED